MCQVWGMRWGFIIERHFGFFYRVMKQRGYYSFANPLVDPVSALHAMIEGEPEDLGEYPHMPACSGVEPPRYKMRLSDSYFKLEGEEWILT